MNSRYQQKLKLLTDFTTQLATLSVCKRKQVGCIVVPEDFTRVLAIGYNGPPAGLPNDLCSATEGACGCIHAEMNALLKLSITERTLLMLTTLSPCKLCAGMIINSQQVKSVLYKIEHSDTSGNNLLRSAGINVIKL